MEDKVICDYCKEKEIDGVLMMGGKTFKVCSPECMDKLIKSSDKDECANVRSGE